MEREQAELERSRRLADKMKGDVDAGRLPQVVFDTFVYFMERIQELEARVDILEQGMERIGPIIGQAPRPRTELERWDEWKRLKKLQDQEDKK